MRSPASRPLAVAALVGAALAVPVPSSADIKTASAVLSASIEARTSLRVSTPVLRFDVVDSGAQVMETAVEFLASARTRTGGDVVLTVEADGSIQGPFGAADAETALSFEGEGAGTTAGSLEVSGPQVAGRWTGSGQRAGRLRFSLSGAVNPGTYLVPVRLILSAP